MDRKVYIGDEIVSLIEYIDSQDDVDCYHCWQDEETQKGYNLKFTRSFEEWSANTSIKSRFIATIKRLSDDVSMGAIFLSPEGTSPDLAILIYKPYRGNGYGVRAFSLGIKHCFEAFSFDYITAGCYAHNIASMKMLQRCGFLPHPQGNQNEKHYRTGEDIVQLDFVTYKPFLAFGEK